VQELMVICASVLGHSTIEGNRIGPGLIAEAGKGTHNWNQARSVSFSTWSSACGLRLAGGCVWCNIDAVHSGESGQAGR
jgi:hypothetical protein